MTETKIGVVMAVRDCLGLTQATIESVRTRHAVQLYVVDDRSDRETKDWLGSRGDIVTFTDPSQSTGLAWNWNLGIAAAVCDGCTHILVINNDIVLHPQAIDRMAERLDRGDVLMVTGTDIGKPPASVGEYFSGEAEESEAETPSFACFMVNGETLRRAGWFDENFVGAYYEDNDYHAMMCLRGEKAVCIGSAPFYHHGTATIKAHQQELAGIQERANRNAEYFCRKWGRPPAGSVAEMRQTYATSSPWAQACVSRGRMPVDSRLEAMFRQAVERPSDINEHINTLFRLASGVSHVTEFAGGECLSTYGFALAKPQVLRRYQRERSCSDVRIAAVARMAGVDYVRAPQEGVDAEIEPTDLLFIDTLHVEERMRDELERHAHKVRRYLIMHDTETYGQNGEAPGRRGVWPAIASYMRRHPEWRLLHHFANNNGLTVFIRV